MIDYTVCGHCHFIFASYVSFSNDNNHVRDNLMLFSACDQSKFIVVRFKRVTAIANCPAIFFNPRETFFGIDVVGQIAPGKRLPSPPEGDLRCALKMAEGREERLLRLYRPSEIGL